MRKKMKWNVFGVVFLVVLGLSLYPVMSAQADCPEGLISYWPLDESEGPDYEDVVGKNDGVGSPDPTAFAEGQVGGAQYFGGEANNQSIEVFASHTFGWLASSSFSIELWAKPDGPVGGSSQVMLGRTDGPFQLWLGIVEPGGEPFFVLSDGSNSLFLIGDQALFNSDDLEKWYHLVVVRDGVSGATTLYVDGNAVDTNSGVFFSNGFSSQTASLYIGQFQPGDKFSYKGWLDEVALYDRALDIDEIPAHYNAGLAGDSVTSLRPPPIAVAGENQNVKVGTAVVLSAANSTGAGPLAYLWTQADPALPLLVDNAITKTVEFNAPDEVAGDAQTFTFQLRVTPEDPDDSRFDIDTVTVTVSAAPVVLPDAPTADAGDDQSVVQRNLVTLDGSGSTGSGTLSFSWIQTDGPIVTLAGADTDTATFTAPEVDAAGEILIFTLTVTDDQGLSDTDTIEVTVSAFAPGGGGGGGGCFINSMF